MAEIGPLIFFALLSGLMVCAHVGVHISSTGDNSCHDRYTTWMITWYTLILSNSIIAILYYKFICRLLMDRLKSLFTLSIYLLSIVIMRKYIRVLIHTPHCMSSRIIIFDGIFLGLTNLINAFIAAIVIGVCLMMCCKGYHVNNTRVQYEKDLDKISDPSFDFSKFMQKHKDTIDDFPYSDKELQLLFTHCTTICTHPQATQDDEDSPTCPICLDGFPVDGKIFTHPKCAHLFHEECIHGWLKKCQGKMRCPSCNLFTRTAFLNLLRAKLPTPMTDATVELAITEGTELKEEIKPT